MCGTNRHHRYPALATIGVEAAAADQKGVPTKVFFLVMVLVSCPLTPKSAILTSPVDESRMLAAVDVIEAALGGEKAA